MKAGVIAVGLVLAAALLLSPFAEAGRGGGGGGGGGLRIAGADYSDPNGFVRIYATIKDGRVRFQFPRVSYNWYARSAKLCGRQFAPALPPSAPSDGYGRGTSSVFLPKAVARLSNGRFRWRGGRPRFDSIGRRIATERITIKGRRTGPRSARLAFTWRYKTKSVACTKTFRVKLSTKPLPPPPDRTQPPTESDEFVGEATDGDVASGHYLTRKVFIYRRRGPGTWQVEVVITKACGQDEFGLRADSSVRIGVEIPIQGERLEVPPTAVTEGQGTIALSGTHTPPTATRSDQISGTISSSVSFEGKCSGTYSSSDQFRAFG